MHATRILHLSVILVVPIMAIACRSDDKDTSASGGAQPAVVIDSGLQRAAGNGVAGLGASTNAATNPKDSIVSAAPAATASSTDVASTSPSTSGNGGTIPVPIAPASVGSVPASSASPVATGAAEPNVSPATPVSSRPSVSPAIPGASQPGAPATPVAPQPSGGSPSAAPATPGAPASAGGTAVGGGRKSNWGYGGSAGRSAGGSINPGTTDTASRGAATGSPGTSDTATRGGTTRNSVGAKFGPGVQDTARQSRSGAGQKLMSGGAGGPVPIQTDLRGKNEVKATPRTVAPPQNKGAAKAALHVRLDTMVRRPQ